MLPVIKVIPLDTSYLPTKQKIYDGSQIISLLLHVIQLKIAFVFQSNAQ